MAIATFSPPTVAPVLHYLHSLSTSTQAHGRRTMPVLPFVTLSRQAGAGALTLGRKLAEHLNAQLSPEERPWAVFDRELVEKVAADHHIAAELVDMLEQRNRTWLTDFLSGISADDRRGPGELTVFRYLASTVRALAQAGRVILAGRGSVLITRGMPGGLHVRLIAPLEHRIATMMRLHGETHAQAAARVDVLDRAREAFFRTYWPTLPVPLPLELFDVTFNSAALSEAAMVQALSGILEKQPVEAGV